MEEAETLTAAQRQEGTQLLCLSRLDVAHRSFHRRLMVNGGCETFRTYRAENGEGVARVLAIPMPDLYRLSSKAGSGIPQQSQAVQDDGGLAKRCLRTAAGWRPCFFRCSPTIEALVRHISTLSKGKALQLSWLGGQGRYSGIRDAATAFWRRTGAFGAENSQHFP